jgi:hypothetical protein
MRTKGKTRKPPQQAEPELRFSPDHALTQKAAQCEECKHVWFLRTPRIGRCPGCARVGTAHPVEVHVAKRA